MLKSQLIHILLLIQSADVFCQTRDDIAAKCGTHTTCSSCLNFDENCAWCSKWDLNINPKCNKKENLILSGCDLEHIQTFKKSVVDIKKDREFQDISTNINETIQIKPQHIHVILKQNEVKSLKIQIKPVENYPMDMYMLMDVSDSVRSSKDAIASLSTPLTETLKSLTENYRVGFGTFCDKPLMPIVDLRPKYRQNACPEQEEKCEPTYDFKHRLSMTSDVQNFTTAVNETIMSANLDDPDGCLDALMQIVVCHKEIGWDNYSRKIIIIGTASALHVAGDGLLAGILKPNDEKCHLDKDGFYSEALNQDYPSISQIFKVLEKEKINAVFAVEETKKEYYDQLKELIPNFMHVVILQPNASNIIELINQTYKRIFSKIKLRDNAMHPIQLKYNSACGLEKIKENVDSCDNVKTGQVYEFNIELKYTSCPQNKSDLKQTIKIEEANLGAESVIVDVELICDCECAYNSIVQSNNCNSKGNEICGQCHCDTEWSGRKCECNIYNNSLISSFPCFNNVTNTICSERGNCRCGVCECDIGYIGTYCECIDCPSVNNKICNGHGTCKCGQCQCNSGWSGKDCKCSADEINCVAPNETQPCSENGKCECGKCECINDGNHRFEGTYCEDDLRQECQVYENCVFCLHTNTEDHCKQTDCMLGERMYQNFTKNEFTNDELQTACIYRHSFNTTTCEYFFISIRRNHQIRFKLHPEQCGETALQASVWFFGIIGVIALMYIVFLVVLKYRNYKKDKIEYMNFMHNIEKIKLEEPTEKNSNPLYKSPITQVDLSTIQKKTD